MKKITVLVAALFLGGTVLIISSCKKELPNAVKEDPLVSASECSACETESAFPDRKGIVKKVTIDGVTLTYEEIDGEAVYQGDILLDIADLSELGKTNGAGKRLLGNRWPENKVYFAIAPDISDTMHERIMAAIKTWENNTNISFIPHTGEANFVTFRDGDGCSSAIGMQRKPQYITAGKKCTTGNLIHEIGHTIGLFHEHTRADRNDYVEVHFDEIEDGKTHNFDIYKDLNNADFDQGAMDFESVMLYGSYAFSKDDKPTITRRVGSPIFVGQRKYLSREDLATINMMYPRSWNNIPGSAADIGAGAGATFMIHTRVLGSESSIYEWAGNDWTAVNWDDENNGYPARVDADQAGNPWVINEQGAVYRRNGNAWEKLPGIASDIGIGGGGAVYIIGTTPEPGGYGIYKWNGIDWDKQNGAGVRITVDDAGAPWFINATGTIYRQNGSALQTIPGNGQDIGAGPDGSVFLIGSEPGTNGHAIYQWSGSDWVEVSGGAEMVDVGSGGRPWIVNDKNEIYNKE